MKLLVYIEQYNVVGILPSQLESLALLSVAMGITETAYIDNTPDGFRRTSNFTRYNSLEEFLNIEKGPFVLFSPIQGEDIRSVGLPSDAWLIFGPSMGFNDEIVKFKNNNIIWAKIPGGELNSRDAVPIALWETSKWRE